MATKEIVHLVGTFKPDVLERWTLWAERTNRIIRHTTFQELDGKIYRHSSPIIILDDHGLNDLPLP